MTAIYVASKKLLADSLVPDVLIAAMQSGCQPGSGSSGSSYPPFRETWKRKMRTYESSEGLFARLAEFGSAAPATPSLKASLDDKHKNVRFWPVTSSARSVRRVPNWLPVYQILANLPRAIWPRRREPR